jgi:hypothetical protein
MVIGCPLQNLIHEYADHVAVAVADILSGAKDIVWPEDDVVEAEQIPCTPAIPSPRSYLAIPYESSGARQILFARRRRGAAVHRNRRSEDETTGRRC